MGQFPWRVIESAIDRYALLGKVASNNLMPSFNILIKKFLSKCHQNNMNNIFITKMLSDYRCAEPKLHNGHLVFQALYIISATQGTQGSWRCLAQ
jgi:hypothetical protein